MTAPGGRIGGEVGIDLYWLPLGAGDRAVRVTGVVYESIAARLASRRRLELYHAALQVRTADEAFVVEVTPHRWGAAARAGRGVVAAGPLALPGAGRLPLFRYELRCWRDGIIVDVDHAVASPVRISDDARAAGRLLELVPSVPICTWGRDDLGAGEMWTSNSVIAWLLARAALPPADLCPPPGGRAPGWNAGLRIAGRDDGYASARAAPSGDGHRGELSRWRVSTPDG